MYFVLRLYLAVKAVKNHWFLLCRNIEKSHSSLKPVLKERCLFSIPIQLHLLINLSIKLTAPFEIVSERNLTDRPCSGQFCPFLLRLMVQHPSCQIGPISIDLLPEDNLLFVRPQCGVAEKFNWGQESSWSIDDTVCFTPAANWIDYSTERKLLAIIIIIDWSFQ